MSKHFLYLTNDKLVGLLINGQTLVGRENFALADIATAEFDAYLESRKRVPAFLVTDLIEEDFRQDTIPHLSGSDQQAVIDRKLGQLYRSSPYRHAIVQGREEEGRRDDQVFLHAVTNADVIKPILDALEKHAVPLEGIYSSAVLSSRLLKELDIFFPHTMLVTIIPDFGLRQTYFKDKQVKFSRLTPIIYDESRSVGQLIAAETSRTWQYLDSLRFFGPDDSLEVCMLTHERDREMMQEAIRTFPMLRYRFLDITEVAAKLKVTPAPTSSHAEEILCHLYSRGGIENHFAEKKDTRFSTFRRTRLGLVGATALVLAAGVTGGAFNLYQATRIGAEIDNRALQERALQAEYQSVVTSMRTQKMSTDTVRDTSTFFNSQVRPLPATPGGMLKEIAVAIDEFPLVTVNQITWGTSNDSNAALFTPPGGGMPNQTMAVTSVSKSATSAVAVPAMPALDANPPLAGNKYHIALLDLAIQPFDGNIRNALLEIEKFTARMRTLPGYQTKVTVSPVDMGSQASLKVIDSKNATAAAAAFTIRLVKQVPDT